MTGEEMLKRLMEMSSMVPGLDRLLEEAEAGSGTVQGAGWSIDLTDDDKFDVTIYVDGDEVHSINGIRLIERAGLELRVYEMRERLENDLQAEEMFRDWKWTEDNADRIQAVIVN